jgi:protease I
MIRAVIITAQGFQDEEVIYPYYRLLEAGYKVDLATPGGEIVHGKYGVPARSTKATEDLTADDYDLVLLPGGFEAPDRLRLRPEVIEFVRRMNAQQKVIAAICHGPWILLTAGIVEGRQVTAYWSIETDVRNSGAHYKHKAPVVVDGNMITSPHYNNNHEFMRAVIRVMDDYQVRTKG